jgi:hypothetical protein
MGRLIRWSLWLFFLPALLVWRGMVLFTLWLAGKAQAMGPAWPSEPQRRQERL